MRDAERVGAAAPKTCLPLIEAGIRCCGELPAHEARGWSRLQTLHLLIAAPTLRWQA
jgi:hypothetical protein